MFKVTLFWFHCFITIHWQLFWDKNRIFRYFISTLICIIYWWIFSLFIIYFLIHYFLFLPVLKVFLNFSLYYISTDFILISFSLYVQYHIKESDILRCSRLCRYVVKTNTRILSGLQFLARHTQLFIIWHSYGMCIMRIHIIPI